MLVITSFKYILIDQLKKQMSDGNSTCPLDPMDKQNSNGHFHRSIGSIGSIGHFRNGYLNGLVSTLCPYACHYVIQIHMVIDQMKKQMSDGNSTCPLDPMDSQTNKIPMDISRSIGSIGSIGHFRLAISMA